MSQRVEYYDFLRGVAILMVVGIHTFVSYPIETPIGCDCCINNYCYCTQNITSWAE